MQAANNPIPAFWSESWRWAAPAWRGRYGAPNREVNAYAGRLIYSEWAARFGLPQRWRPPADARWVALVQGAPAGLHAVAEVLGRIAFLRAGAPVPVHDAAASDRWPAQALRYRDVNSMRVRLVAPGSHLTSPLRSGVSVLCAMARRGWPDAESRFAMLAEPEALGVRGAASGLAATSSLAIDSIDVSRCLSISGAVLRRGLAEPIEEGMH
jgi:hypothetical protein